MPRGGCTAYTVSPTDLIARRSTWEGEGHKTKTHAYVTRAGCVDAVRKNTVTRKIVQRGVTVVFANGIYTPSACDVRVRLGLVALPFQVDCLAIRSVGDRVYGARCLPLLFQGDSIRQLSDRIEEGSSWVQDRALGRREITEFGKSSEALHE